MMKFGWKIFLAAMTSVILVAGISFAETPLAEDGTSTGNKVKNNKKSGNSSHSSKTGGKEDEIEPYTYEFSGRVIFDMKKGAVKPANDSSETVLGQRQIGASVMAGSLLTDHIEPFFEFSYVTTNRDVADYSSSDSVLDLGLGILVNLPQIEKLEGRQKGSHDDTVPDLMQAKWIPYVGVLIGNSNSTNVSGVSDASKAKVKDSNTYTKFLVGTRWFIYPHISLNFGARILYEKSSTSAESTTKNGADRSKIEIELNLLSMSLFI